MTAQHRAIRLYDRALTSDNYRRYFGDSGFYNFGFWDSCPQSQHEACEALVDLMLDRVPNKGGRILDVACGPGATTKRLLRHFPAERVTGINISEAQLAAARERVPGASFVFMDATRLGFADEQFDAVICVEAAFHFKTRDRFIQEAMRVLKPGGNPGADRHVVPGISETDRRLRTDAACKFRSNHRRLSGPPCGVRAR